MDVLGCAWVENEVVIWFNRGQGLSWTRQSVTTDFAQCHWVDLGDWVSLEPGRRLTVMESRESDDAHCTN